MTTTNPEDARLQAAFAWVDAAYQTLSKVPPFVAREAQVRLSKAVAQTIVNKVPLAAEAPTGTGKTLAYLLGALACARTLPQGVKEPMVVSTATKALQQQLLSSDLPRLVQSGIIKPEEVVIAKGKSNYLCQFHARSTLELLQQAQDNPELFVFQSAEQVDEAELSAMLESFENDSWNGDFDHYEGPRTFNVRPVAVNGDTCLRKKCEHYNNCAYVRARSKLTDATLVVANHDLLLLDLLLSSSGLEGTLPLAAYSLIVDEAHHLPDKAISVGSSELPVTQLLQALPKLAGAQKILRAQAELLRLLDSRNLSADKLERDPLTTALRTLNVALEGITVDEETNQRRFARGQLDAGVRDALTECRPLLDSMVSELNSVVAVLREASGLSPTATERASDVMRRLLDVKVLAEDSLRCTVAYLGTGRYAKWLFRHKQSLSLHAAPLEGADVLTPLMWTNRRVKSVVMVSATLRDFGGFERYRRRVGMPANGVCTTLPSQFNYPGSELVVAAFKATPKPAERKAFFQELARELPARIDAKEATLVLFPSWAMLKEFVPKLRERFGERMVRVQGDSPVRMLLRGHCAATDAGQGSILVGVATLSEGLDLPGKYCTHVVIVALPFAAPNDPVEQELAEQLGPRYFGERSLPDAMVRLTQMVGRLLRREDDRGRITVLDRRLAATSYGRQMLKALPAFKKVIEPLASAEA